MKRMVKKYLLIAGGSLLVLLVAGEVYLRREWGFCDSVLMQSDPDFEYIAQPDQNRYRFKRHIVYNAYSQRNTPVDSSAFIVLGLGDSVLNGGALTDQDSLATSRLSNDLSTFMGKDVQVLNISAGSWGPDNCEAYLKRYGMFSGKVAFLVCSSHDAHDNINHQSVIDVLPGFSSRQYLSAWIELFDRYLIPRYLLSYLGCPDSDKGVSEISKDGKVFNTGFEALASRFRHAGIPFFIWLHPEKTELERGTYNREGKEILEFCVRDTVPVIEGLKYMSFDDYRDNIHLNEHGQQKLAEHLSLFSERILTMYE
ncbi:hypothetical protein HMPREF1212_03013 [Parabacteroides sp. HGS0025]|uniref:hypothetical protein n=1 Tax=Parabacteroides sp. HGS0025 TaxID=1078087 RepID=UPI0006175961|nr:hypothetical protein [Parabacteroides sp. HGS0025]KKB49854.1 hypothetical protein HMPREF1212_03013 [Parabacteroides sp. HGS0025]